MKRPKFETVEKNRPSSMLILDKEGVITNGMVPFFSQGTSVVVVGVTSPLEVPGIRVEFVSFRNVMPTIPDLYYSHLFVVVNGQKDVLVLIPQFLEKARRDGVKIFFIVDLFFASPPFLQELTYSYRNAFVFVTGDFFGKNVPFNIEKTIYRFFDDANSSNSLLVSGDGLIQTFPVLFSDMVESVLREALGKKTPKISYVFPKHAPTEISLARMFQTINPFLRIDFVDEKRYGAQVLENRQKAQHAGGAGTYLLQNNYPLLKKIKESTLLSEEQVIKVSQKEVSPKASFHALPKKTKKNSSLSYVAYFLLFLILAPLFITCFFGGLGFITLMLTKKALMSGDLLQAKKHASLSQTLFGLAKTTGNVLSLETNVLGMGIQGEKVTEALTLGEDGSYGLVNGIDALRLTLLIFQKRSGTPVSDFTTASNQMKKAITIFEKMQAEKNMPFLTDMDSMVRLLGATIDSYSTLLGMDSPKTYLVLFQNNAELRPTGGFIGSYGLLTLDKGSVSDFQIHDVYDADGQLTGHVEPPYPIRRYMQVVHLYLRDSNFSPDFSTASSDVANMLRLETGQSVSGVIGVDVSFLKMVVSALGPVYVADYKETVTPENFYILTQSHAEKNFFPGSTQKKDFLRSLFTALQLRISGEKPLPYFLLAKTFVDALAQKHILFAFPDGDLQHIFAINNLSSSLLDSRILKTNQYTDTFGVSEANIGANKANAYLYRKVDQRVSIDSHGSILNTVTIRFKNDSKDWPGGDYKSYFRVITPKGSILQEITIDGQKQTIVPAITDYLLYERKDFVSPVGLEVETTQELEKTLFGFLIIVPKASFKTVSLSYSSPQFFDNQQALSYDLWYIKQSGTDEYPYSFVLSFPNIYKVLGAPKDLTVTDASVVFEKNITTDQYFHINLSKK